ncbi:hypothetical protein N9D23_05245 [Rubripirellula sp.]|jgi:uncharacterized membrane protein|nr:hypothetical protein [Rubripirellula sp.]MDF1840602.1 hypothetical protein [Rubripirellula sp.]
MNSNLIFVLNLLATWYMVGLIWMVQIVHYNLFDRVGQDKFVQYEADHGRLITPIVGVPMLFEIVTAGLLVMSTPAGFPKWAAWLGIALVIAIWLSTALLQVPCHNRLMEGFDEVIYRKLVNTNWIRTVFWSARGLLTGYFLLKLMK